MPATSDDGRHVCYAIGEPSSISPLRTVQFRSAQGTRHSALRCSAPAVPGVPSCDRWLIANRVFITSSSHPTVNFEVGAQYDPVLQSIVRVRNALSLGSPLHVNITPATGVSLGLSAFPTSARSIAKKHSLLGLRCRQDAVHWGMYGIMLPSAASSRFPFPYPLRRVKHRSPHPASRFPSRVSLSWHGHNINGIQEIVGTTASTQRRPSGFRIRQVTSMAFPANPPARDSESPLVLPAPNS
ncbi:hypothetical protein LXA43DRAFT_454497 [Ganoderma leucocontextum]|nr:hypothetical protein LXA43DRAFT_454497 [Ganoderma leucocontextum]